jgi:hypothetical protein
MARDISTFTNTASLHINQIYVQEQYQYYESVPVLYMDADEVPVPVSAASK